MITLREAANGLLDAVVAAIESGDWKIDGACDPTVEIIRLKNALSQPVDAVNMSQECVDETAKGGHEPVAWQVMVGNEALKEFPIEDMAHDWCVKQKLNGSSSAYWIRPLYTAPPKRKPLSSEKIEQCCYEVDSVVDDRCQTRKWTEAFARAIEAAHGIKENT